MDETMHSIMLLDDEPYVRQMLRTLGPWEACGYTIACECINGQDALTHLEEKTVDVVFCDLRMPVMDGLTFMRKAKEHYPDLLFVVVSAFDDFHLVREAFLLGAQEYLLKSEMEADDIAGILQRLRPIIREKRLQATRDGQITSALLSHYLEQCVSEVIPQHELMDLAAVLPSEKPMTVLCAACPGNSDMRSDARRGLHDALVPCGLLAETVRGMQYLLIEKTDAAVLEDILHTLGTHGMTINLGMENISSYTALPQAVRNAQRACQMNFLVGNGSLVRAENSFASPPAVFQAEERLAQMRSMLLGESVQEDCIDFLAFRDTPLHLRDIRGVQEIFRQYQVMVEETARKWQEDGMERLAEECLTLLRENGDLHSLQDWLGKVADQVRHRQRGLGIMAQVVDYVDTHYTEDLSLTSLAATFFLSPAYISRLFPQTVGENFVDYLTSLRIRRATDLMRTRNLKLYEISEQVGFHSQDHFSRAFRKVTGMSPREYQNKSGL